NQISAESHFSSQPWEREVALGARLAAIHYPSENSETPHRNSGPATDVSHSQYTAAWVESIRDQSNFEKQICSQISTNERAIDAKQSIIQRASSHHLEIKWK
ncbi:hypothetical protein AVEN_61415-1, partial [Araneus ventricosus]